MIEAVDFVSLDTFAALPPAPSMVAVSVGDPEQALPANLEGFTSWLRLEFLDCEEEDVRHHGVPAGVLCSRMQLQRFLAFVRRHHATPRLVRLVVHCRMGSSRSAALALIAHRVAGCAFPRLADAHYANKHVVQLAERELGEAITIPAKTGDEPHQYLSMELQI